LRGQGFDVTNFGTGEDFLKAFEVKKPNMILLDMMLPGIQGRDLLKILRSNPQNQNIVIIIVSAKSLVSDKIDGLNLGADDYIAKPFDINEFISRINAHYRRHTQAEHNSTKTLNIKDYVIDLDNKTIKKGTSLLDITPSEYDIAELLFLNEGKTVSKLEVAEKLYGTTDDQEKLRKEFRTIDMHVKDLRQKLSDSDKSFIQTVFGNGYTIS
jgi:two-component system alkaline phosphatase synthesis response regulator PhoP